MPLQINLKQLPLWLLRFVLVPHSFSVENFVDFYAIRKS